MACAVKRCKSHASRSKNTNEIITYHRFPKDDVLKNEWLRRIARANWTPKIRSIICSKHFTADSFDQNEPVRYRRLKENVVPTLHLTNETNSVVLEEKKKGEKKKEDVQQQAHTNGSLEPQTIVYLECAEITNDSEILNPNIEVKEENMELSHDFEEEKLFAKNSKSPAVISDDHVKQAQQTSLCGNQPILPISDDSNFQILTDGQWSHNSQLRTDGQVDVKIERSESSDDDDNSNYQKLLGQDEENIKIFSAEMSLKCNCKHQNCNSNCFNKMVQELKSEFEIARVIYEKEINRLQRKLKSSRKVCDRRFTKINTLHKRIKRLEEKNVSLYKLLTKKYVNEK